MEQKKIALVTGGSRGIGRNIALNLLEKNLAVVITYHSNREAADEVVRQGLEMGGDIASLQLDSSDTSGFEDFFQRLSALLNQEFGIQKIDYLINNAGTGLYTSFAETTEDQFDEMMNIHFKGVYFLTQKAVNLMNDGGGIVNISSGLARFTFPNCSAYAAMKGGVEVFTRYLAKELGHRNIKANVIAPGAVATDFGGGGNRDNEERRSMISSLTALGRVGEAEDIGSAVAFLCTHDAHWITGQRIEASGGTML